MARKWQEGDRRVLYVVTDYENDFVDGALGFPGAEKLDEGIVRRGEEIRRQGGMVVEVHDTHGPDYLDTREGKALPVIHTVPGTKGWEIYGKTGEWLKTFPHILINKPGFGLSPEAVLQLPDGVEEIEVVGLVTNMCVISVAVTLRARYPEARVVVHKDLVASFDPELHRKALDVMRGLQMEVV